MIKRFLFVLILLLLAACSKASPSSPHTFPMAPLSDMPASVKAAPPAVQEAYQFAAANPGVMQHIPCYCGCGAMGHTSNYACYVKDVEANGKIDYDDHALGCSICVDITRDVMRLLDDGKPLSDIRTYIDQTYAQYGPSNIQP
jgi:hypothetical protein